MQEPPSPFSNDGTCAFAHSLDLFHQGHFFEIVMNFIILVMRFTKSPDSRGIKEALDFQSHSESFEHPGDVGPCDTPGVSTCTKCTRGIATESDRNKNMFLATHQNFQRTVSASAATPPARWWRPRHPSLQGSAPTARTPEMLPRGAGVQALSAFISAHLRADADLQSINWHPRSLYWPARPVLTTHSHFLHFIILQITDASLHRNIMFCPEIIVESCYSKRSSPLKNKNFTPVLFYQEVINQKLIQATFS